MHKNVHATTKAGKTWKEIKFLSIKSFRRFCLREDGKRIDKKAADSLLVLYVK